MPHNPNPLTKKQEKFLSAIRRKLIEIRNPDKEVEDNRSYEFYLEHTKTFGTIPKMRLKPNSLAMKEEIMKEIGYEHVVEKTHWRARRNAAAKLFDSYWDNLMFRLVKAGRMLAQFNQMFAEESREFSDLLKLVQFCIELEKIEEPHNPNDASKPSRTLSNYAEQLENIGISPDD